MYACVFVYMRVCAYACLCVCVFVYMRVCVYACLCICMFVCMRVCVYACLCVCIVIFDSTVSYVISYVELCYVMLSILSPFSLHSYP